MPNYINHINISGNDYLVKDATHKDIKFYYPTGIAAVTTSPYYCSRWDVADAEVTAYEDGMMVWLEVPVAGNGTYGTAFQINSLGYKPVVYNVNSMITTRYGVGSRIWCIYNSTQTGALYLNSESSTTVTGCWQIMDYNTDTTAARGYNDYYFRTYAGSAIYRYKFLMEGANHRLYPIVTTNQESATQVTKSPQTVGLRPWKIWYYNATTTVSAGGAIGAQTIYPAMYGTTAVYNFNASTGTYKWIYLVGDYNKDTDLFTLNQSTTGYYLFVSQNVTPSTSTFTTGKYYLLLGASYSTTNYFSLFNVNPFYYFDGTNLIPVTTKIAKDSGKTYTLSTSSATAITSLSSSSFTPKTGISTTSSFTAIKTLATNSFTPKTGISVTSSITAITALNSTTITPITKNTVMTSATYSSGILTFSTGDSVTEGTAVSVATPTPKTTATALQTVSLTDGTQITYVTGASTTDTALKSVSLTDGTAINYITGVGSNQSFLTSASLSST